VIFEPDRIRGELLKLGIVVSNRSIRRYRWRTPRPGGTQSWRTFLTNELKGIWAADLCVVQTLGFRTLYVFFFVTHARREVVHLNVTARPDRGVDLAAVH
jgi:putative transposase